MNMPAEELIFGHAKLSHKGLVQLYSDKFVPISQIAFVLGKLLPMPTEVWISDEVPDVIPEDWIRLTVEVPEGITIEEDILAELPNRTRGWFTPARHVVMMYHQRFSPELEVVEVIEDLPEYTAEPESIS